MKFWSLFCIRLVKITLCKIVWKIFPYVNYFLYFKNHIPIFQLTMPKTTFDPMLSMAGHFDSLFVYASLMFTSIYYHLLY